jgi:hypothetical protein
LPLLNEDVDEVNGDEVVPVPKEGVDERGSDGVVEANGVEMELPNGGAEVEPNPNAAEEVDDGAPNGVATAAVGVPNDWVAVGVPNDGVAVGIPND